MNETLPVTPHPIMEEELAWEQAVDQILGDSAELISVSRYVGDSRVYGQGERVAKIRSLLALAPEDAGRLEHEAAILRHLGVESQYGKRGEWEWLIEQRFNGTPLDALAPRLSAMQRARILVRLVPEIQRLHAQGVAHRDLRQDNILVNGDGHLHLVDFDRAAIESRWAANVSDWLGLGPSGVAPSVLWQLALFTLVPKTQSVARRLRAVLFGVNRAESPLPVDPELRLLAQAWALAERSAANAAGQQVAYYAFTHKHRHFEGERPWYLRWEAIRRAVNFEGKRLLELGSNMGLLSSFAMIHGAKSAIGVDRDQSIVEAARLVARALRTGASFERVDLVADPAWEAKLAGADLVAAMSLLHWLPNQERVWRFLAAHEEIIYEGHDSLETELSRLHAAGFDDVSTIIETERGRFVLHGRKARRRTTREARNAGAG